MPSRVPSGVVSSEFHDCWKGTPHYPSHPITHPADMPGVLQLFRVRELPLTCPGSSDQRSQLKSQEGWKVVGKHTGGTGWNGGPAPCLTSTKPLYLHVTDGPHGASKQPTRQTIQPFHVSFFNQTTSFCSESLSPKVRPSNRRTLQKLQRRTVQDAAQFVEGGSPPSLKSFTRSMKFIACKESQEKGCHHLVSIKKQP